MNNTLWVDFFYDTPMQLLFRSTEFLCTISEGRIWPFDLVKEKNGKALCSYSPN